MLHYVAFHFILLHCITLHYRYIIPTTAGWPSENLMICIRCRSSKAWPHFGYDSQLAQWCGSQHGDFARFAIFETNIIISISYIYYIYIHILSCLENFQFVWGRNDEGQTRSSKLEEYCWAPTAGYTHHKKNPTRLGRQTTRRQFFIPRTVEENEWIFNLGALGIARQTSLFRSNQIPTKMKLCSPQQEKYGRPTRATQPRPLSQRSKRHFSRLGTWGQKRDIWDDQLRLMISHCSFVKHVHDTFCRWKLLSTLRLLPKPQLQFIPYSWAEWSLEPLRYFWRLVLRPVARYIRPKPLQHQRKTKRKMRRKVTDWAAAVALL